MEKEEQRVMEEEEEAEEEDVLAPAMPSGQTKAAVERCRTNTQKEDKWALPPHSGPLSPPGVTRLPACLRPGPAAEKEGTKGETLLGRGGAWINTEREVYEKRIVGRNG